MILACQNISKAFGTEEILNHISFHIEDREKAAIIGINGAGKSTLLKIIMHELSADEGRNHSCQGQNYRLPRPASVFDRYTHHL